MTGTLRVTVDTVSISPAETIARAACVVPLMVIMGRLFTDLAAELGGEEQAARHLARVATRTGKPIAVNLPTGAGASTTVFISPRGWSGERLKGWAAGHHEALEAMFGAATIREDV